MLLWPLEPLLIPGIWTVGDGVQVAVRVPPEPEWGERWTFAFGEEIGHLFAYS